MNIIKAEIIEVPHVEQRYDTIGDWRWRADSILQVKVSQTGNEKYNFLIALHEYIEANLCRFQNVSEESVDAFDMNYKGQYPNEPGNDPKAPYHKQHMKATMVEFQVASFLGLDWREYVAHLEKIK